jgi:hypothetical protein
MEDSETEQEIPAEASDSESSETDDPTDDESDDEPPPLESEDSEVEDFADDRILYTDVGNVTDMASNGLITVKQFRKAQRTDEFCRTLMDNNKTDQRFRLIDGILCKITDGHIRAVLPKCLYDTIVATKHFTAFGAHMSMSRILRDVRKDYYFPGREFKEKLRKVTKECYICQLYNTNVPAHELKQLPKVTAPRVSWSIDMITDTPVSVNGKKQILLCVDDFSSYVVCIPVKDATSENIIKALKENLFNQFGIPKTIRSDQQASFYNSALFYTQMERLGVTLTTTAVASPFSNARAESQIKNIKHMLRKFVQQEGVQNRWDEYIQILTNSHNKSIGTYGWSAEELMFGNKIGSRIDILDFNVGSTNQKQYVDHVLKKANEARDAARRNMDNKALSNRTFKNKNKVLKDFKVGSLVLHKCLQASTGSSSKYKPLFTGPYIILKLDKDGCTAALEHITTGKLIRAHFTNLQLLTYSPETIRLRGLFDQEFLQKLANNSINEDELQTSDDEPQLVRSDSQEY